LYASAYILADYNRIKKGDWFQTLMAYNIGPYNWTEKRTKIGHKYATDVVKYWWGFQNFVDAKHGISRKDRPAYAIQAPLPNEALRAHLNVQKAKEASGPLVFTLSSSSTTASLAAQTPSSPISR